MTHPDDFHGSMLAALARLLKCRVEDLPLDQHWNERKEQEMSHATETRDEEGSR